MCGIFGCLYKRKLQRKRILYWLSKRIRLEVQIGVVFIMTETEILLFVMNDFQF